MSMIKLVIFDLDGTLLDTIGDLSAACDAMLALHGFPRHTQEGYRRMVGNGIRRLVERSLPEDRRDEQTVERARRSFVEYYVEHIDVFTRPYDGIETVLKELSECGVKMAVVSNKFQRGTERLIGRFFGDTEFVAVFGQREGIPLKPDPCSDFEIMRIAGVGCDETLHVGDSAVDIAAAKAAGVRSVGVSWGFRPREELELGGADRIIDAPEELIEVLNELNR